MAEQLDEEAKKLMASVYDRGINIYMMINRTKKDLKRVDNFPASVIIEVCKEYTRFKDIGKIRNDYTWFLRVLKAKSAEWNANQQIKEHAQYKKKPPMAQSVKDILKGMAND